MNASPINTRGGSSTTSGALSQQQQSPTNNLVMPVPVPAQSAKGPSTDAFLNNFTLVAEAAKRAQVAVMVRDFENCAL